MLTKNVMFIESDLNVEAHIIVFKQTVYADEKVHTRQNIFVKSWLHGH